MTNTIAQLTVSVAVLAAFACAAVLVLSHGVPPTAEAIANVVLGTLGALASAVVNYWLGSSSGSARKTELLANSIPVEQTHAGPLQ